MVKTDNGEGSERWNPPNKFTYNYARSSACGEKWDVKMFCPVEGMSLLKQTYILHSFSFGNLHILYGGKIVSTT